MSSQYSIQLGSSSWLLLRAAAYVQAQQQVYRLLTIINSNFQFSIFQNKMKKMSDKICKHNQTGFCKFRNMCKRRHENEMCGRPTDCKTEGGLKRHPKVCRNFTQNKSCRHKEKCSYQHLEEVICSKQSDMNELMIQIISKR